MRRGAEREREGKQLRCLGQAGMDHKEETETKGGGVGGGVLSETN